MNVIKSTRNIKCLGNCVKPDELYLHPITLKLYKNKSKNKLYCPSEFHYDMDGPTYASLCSKNDLIRGDENSSLDIKKFMALPYLNLSVQQMLNIYKINEIDSLISWVDKMIKEDEPYVHVNRIICIWIKFNFNDMKENNDILIPLYKKISNKYWNNIDIDKHFIKKWFKTKKYDDFSFNLGLDLYNMSSNL
jgi:hypothetical protein